MSNALRLMLKSVRLLWRSALLLSFVCLFLLITSFIWAVSHPTLHNKLWPYLEQHTDGQIHIGASQGTLWQGLRLHEIKVNHPRFEFEATELAWKWSPHKLITQHLHLKSLSLTEAELTLKPSQAQTSRAAKAPFFWLPYLQDYDVRINMDSVKFEQVKLTQQKPNQAPYQRTITSFESRLRYYRQLFTIYQFELDSSPYRLSTQGDFHLIDTAQFSLKLDTMLEDSQRAQTLQFQTELSGRVDQLAIKLHGLKPFEFSSEHQLSFEQDKISLESIWHQSDLDPKWHVKLHQATTSLIWQQKHLRVAGQLNGQYANWTNSQHQFNVHLTPDKQVNFDLHNTFDGQIGELNWRGQLNLVEQTLLSHLSSQQLNLQSILPQQNIQLNADIDWQLNYANSWHNQLDIDHLNIAHLEQEYELTGQVLADYDHHNKLIQLNTTQLTLNHQQTQLQLSGQVNTNLQRSFAEAHGVTLKIGDNQINLDAVWHDILWLKAEGNLTNLNQLHPDLRGRSQLDVEINWLDSNHLNGELTLQTSQLGYRNHTLASLKLDAFNMGDSLFGTEGRLEIHSLKNAKQSNLIDQLRFTRQRDVEKGMQSELELLSPLANAQAIFSEPHAKENDRQIQLSWLEITEKTTGIWRLDQPWTFHWQHPFNIASDQSCLLSNQSIHAPICLQVQPDQRLVWTMQSWPIFAWMQPYLPQNIQLEGLWSGQGELNWQQNWHLSQTLLSSDIDVKIKAGGYEWPFELKQVELGGQLNAESLNIHTQAQLNETGELKADVNLNAPWPQAKINGSIALALNEWPISENVRRQFNPQKTELKIETELSGSIKKLEHDTHSNLYMLIDLPLIGLTKQDIHLDALINTHAITAQGLLTQPSKKQAQLNLDITDLTQQPKIALNLKSHSIELFKLPFAHFHSSADLHLKLQDQSLYLTGDLTLHDSLLDLRGLPLQDRTQLSRDEIIIDKSGEPVQKATPPVATHLDLNVSIGQQVKIYVRDAEAMMGGNLRLQLSPETPDMKAFGQVILNQGFLQLDARNRIQIDPSSFNFNGTLANPNLNVNLVRQVEQTQARLNITGTTTQPQFVFYSTPALAQGHVINLLLFGRAADMEREPNYESQVLSAFYKLGIQNNTPVLNTLTRTLGVEDVYFEVQNKQVSNLLLGRALTDNIYVRYVRDLSGQQNDAVQFFYQLTPDWLLKTDSGNNRSSVDLILRKER